MARVKAFIDKHLERWTSRKLLVWSTATTFLALGKLNSDEWVAVSLAYIGIQSTPHEFAATRKQSVQKFHRL